jgi:hypothetical protein
MLTISPETFSRMNAVEEDRFVRKLVGFLQASVPSLANEPPADIYAQARLLTQKARSHDMTSEQAVAAFALTAAQLGLDFVERFAGVRQILFSSHSEDEKAKLLEGFTISLFQTLAR